MTRNEIATGLRRLGLKKGDSVLLHSSLSSLGRVEGGPAAVIDAFLDVLGAEGTLMVPVFGALGILTETLKARPGAVISPCPLGTVAALGPAAEELCRDHWRADTVHGADTPYTRLAELGGHICLLGVDQDRNTTLHSVEALLELPYLSDSTAAFETPGGETVTRTWKYYPGPHRDFIGLDRCFREAGVMRTGRIGNAEVRLIKSQDLLDIALAAGRKDPAFALCGNPACADCVRQRAAIFAGRMDRESFTLTASSRLAGRYVPEIIDNLKAAGIRFVELDYLEGKACAFFSPEKLLAAVREFEADGIGVSALRAAAVPDDVSGLAGPAAAAGIRRLVLPLSEALRSAAAVRKAGLEPVFYNHSQQAGAAARILKEIGGTACFNPPGFVLAGEMPFLDSYRIGRFAGIIGQLDICDCTRDGLPARPARGNGEIKELISILRCRRFSGCFCLGGGAVFPGTLKDAVSDFTNLLDRM